MAQKVRDVMTTKPVALEDEASVVEAARAMRDGDFGFVIVLKDQGGSVSGVVTDRDIAVRVVAEGVDPKEVRLADICEVEVTTVGPDEPADKVVDLMRQIAIMRVPVVEGGRLIGVISLGELAQKMDD